MRLRFSCRKPAVARANRCKGRSIRHLALFTTIEIAQSDHIAGGLIFADQDCRTSVDSVRPSHAALKIAGITEIDIAASAAQRLGYNKRHCLPRIADRNDRDRARRLGRFRDQHGEPLDACGPADAWHRRAAHHLDQPVITSAAHHRSLGAQLCRDEFEG